MENLEEFEAAYPEEIAAIIKRDIAKWRATPVPVKSSPVDEAAREALCRENQELRGQLAAQSQENKKLVAQMSHIQKEQEIFREKAEGLLFYLQRFVSENKPDTKPETVNNHSAKKEKRLDRRLELIREFAKDIPRTPRETAAHLTQVFEETTESMVWNVMETFKRRGLYIPVTAGRRGHGKNSQQLTFKIR
jgi:hypothetical protein